MCFRSLSSSSSDSELSLAYNSLGIGISVDSTSTSCMSDLRLVWMTLLQLADKLAQQNQCSIWFYIENGFWLLYDVGRQQHSSYRVNILWYEWIPRSDSCSMPWINDIPRLLSETLTMNVSCRYVEAKLKWKFDWLSAFLSRLNWSIPLSSSDSKCNIWLCV